MVAWELLDPAARDTFRVETGVDATAWLGGRGWALAVAMYTFPYYWRTMPQRCANRLAMAREAVADAAC